MDLWAKQNCHMPVANTSCTTTLFSNSSLHPYSKPTSAPSSLDSCAHLCLNLLTLLNTHIVSHMVPVKHASSTGSSVGVRDKWFPRHRGYMPMGCPARGTQANTICNCTRTRHVLCKMIYAIPNITAVHSPTTEPTLGPLSNANWSSTLPNQVGAHPAHAPSVRLQHQSAG